MFAIGTERKPEKITLVRLSGQSIFRKIGKLVFAQIKD